MTSTPATIADADPVAAHYTPERQQQLTELAWKPISWQSRSFKWIDGDAGAIDAFRRLLLRLDRYQDLFQGRKLCRAGGRYTNAINGLAALAHHHASWIRSPETWSTAVERNGHPQRADQFGSLARHLLARFDVPTFLDEAWFGPFEAETLRRQGWFLHLATGGSARDLDLPIHLTRRMAHSFMQGRNRQTRRRPH